MDFSLLSVILDIVLVGLLAAAILYGFRLNRHLRALRQSREELKTLLGEFSRSTERAENALEALRRGSRENVGAVREAVERAEALKDDLEFLSKRGEQIADRLEAGVSAGRSAGGGTPPAHGGGNEGGGGGGRSSRSLAADPKTLTTRAAETPAPDGGDAGDGAKKAKSKSDLLRALQGMR